MTDNSKPQRDYRETLVLPKTDFPMRAGLPKREPEWVERWQKLDIYGQLREQSKGRTQFSYHDGPPYANGHVHLGTALNKILKDFVVRSHQMMGYDTAFVPGWDCHGLPIEWKVEEGYRKKGRSKDEVPINEFRAECRAYAQHWLDIQREEFKRLGVFADWDNPYTTMAFSSEARIVSEFLKFAMAGNLYRGSKPVMWSTVEQTALAEAEVEYADHVSTAIWVRFPVTGGEHEGASVLIWTTTPWTIPANRAISFNPKISYGFYEVTEIDDSDFTPWSVVGEKLIVADSLWEAVAKTAKISGSRRLGDVNPKALTCAHPFAGEGYDFAVPMLQGDHVTEEAGTGFVHTAPGHGADDYDVWLANGYREIPETVGPDGVYYDDVPLFAGLDVIRTTGKKTGQDGKANPAVLAKLLEVGALLARSRITHSYPHSWRSKAPIIFRNTPQWFIPMGDDKGEDGLRAKALTALKGVEFFPPRGVNRIGAMVKTRPDWLVSRQRAWGVPLTLFVKKGTGEYLQDEAVNARIIKAIASQGVEAWSEISTAELLGDKYNPDEFEKITDILDVWFDSGCSHAFTLEDRPELKWPADVYLEGSDQHRGWFQSSLMQSCGTRGIAPYKKVVTHGFIMAKDGRKMSKSLGNTMVPNDVARQYGIEILRLWTASCDYQDDMRIGDEILKTAADSYRKIRNTLRYMLGALNGYEAGAAMQIADMPSLERLVLHRLSELDEQVRDGYANFDFKGVFGAVFAFCHSDLSQLFFDIRKDTLYCDTLDEPRRQAALWVMDKVFHSVVKWLAPILPFTTEETWLSRFPSDTDSVHLHDFAPVDESWRNDELAADWAWVKVLRQVSSLRLELARGEKVIGSSLEAMLTFNVTEDDFQQAVSKLADGDANEFLEETFIVSGAKIVLVPEIKDDQSEHVFTVETPTKQKTKIEVIFAKAADAGMIKCARSWKYFDPKTADIDFPEITPRDAKAVREWDVAQG